MGALRVGLRIDRYELTRQIAEGGFGVIFQARDVNLGRELAIKFLLPQHNSNAEIVARFVGEARTLARVVHPGIVTVYESGEVSGTGTKADGTAFILMELLEGETLSQRVKRTGPMPPQQAMEVCRQVANALDAAHQLGMIHRDLKPDNIMLVKDPAIAIGERAKVLDFGIAKNAANSTTTAATQIGMVFGTPAYMSPEQCRSSTDVTPASDVYALGCILFELLLGRPPFLGSGMGELFAAHLMSAPPVPSQLNPSLPRHLDEVIGAMLAKEPTGRPASMTVVERILDESRLGSNNKPARTRTLGGAILAGQLPGQLPFPPKPGFSVEMGPATPVALQQPPVTARGHSPSGPNTPISQPIAQPISEPPRASGLAQGNVAEASTILGAARPAMPTAEEAAAMLRARSPSSVPTPMPMPIATPNATPPAMPIAMPEAQKTVMAPLPAMQAPAAQKTMIASLPNGIPPPVVPPPVDTPRAHANPTTMSSAMGQQTTRPTAPPKSNAKMFVMAGIVVVAAAVAVVVVATNGGGDGGGSAAAQPSGSDPVGSSSSSKVITPGSGSNHTTTGSDTGSNGSAVVTSGSNTGSGSALVTTGSAGSAAGSDAGSAVVTNGNNTGSGSAGSAGSAGSDSPHEGSAHVTNGSNSGSAVVTNGSNAGSATHTGSAQAMVGSNAGSAHAGSATHVGSAAGSGLAHLGSGAGSATAHVGSGAGSAKHPPPHQGSGSAKCVGRGCILDGQF